MNAPDVRVRLSAEGTQEVIDAFRKIQNEQKKSADSSKDMVGALGSLKGAFTALGVAAVAKQFADLSMRIIDTADSIGDLSAATGASAGTLSTWANAAREANVEQNALQKGFVKFSQNLTDAKSGNDKAVQSFRAIGVSLSEIKKLKFDEALKLVAERMSQYEGSAEKVALATDLFGKSGTDLIEILDNVGNEGFASLEQRTRSAGLYMSDDFVQSAAMARQALNQMQGQVTSTAMQFLEGLVPSVSSAMSVVNKSVGVDGVSAFKYFGDFVGKVLNGIIYQFIVVGKTIGTVLGKILGDMTFNATKSWKETFADLKSELGADMQQLFGGASAGSMSSGSANSAPGKLKLLAPGGKQPKEKKEKEDKTAKELYEFQKRLSAEQIKAQEEGFNNELSLLKAQNATRQAELDAQYKQGLITYQQYFDERRLILESETNKDIESIQSKIKILQESINIFGPLTQDQMVEKVKTETEISKLNTELAIKTEELKRKRGEIQQQQIEEGKRVREQQNLIEDQLKNSVRGNLEAGLTDFFTTGITGAKSFGDAFKGMAMSVVQSINQIIAAALAARIVKGIFGASLGGGAGATAGGTPGFATGGYVAGPGSGTSDSIPARLSNGEFVVRQAVVSQPGMLQYLNRINSGMMSPSARSGPRRFADGGLVSNAPMAAGSASAASESKLTVGLDSGLVLKELQSAQGTKIILENISKNKRAIGRVLGS